jgi:NADH:ubiquinone oxidoreductase subunit 6 (subunit J)
MNKFRITYALVLLAVYFISTAAIISSLGIGFMEMADWSGDILLLALFAAAAMTIKFMSEAEKHKSDENRPGALVYILGFRLDRYIAGNDGRYITDKKTGKRFIEKDARRNSTIYLVLAVLMFAFELASILLYIFGTDFTGTDKVIMPGIIAELVLFVLFIFPGLPGFIYLISEFEEVSEDNTDTSGFMDNKHDIDR